MSTLLADPVTGDLVITNNELTLVDGVQEVRQGLASRFRMFMGEWFLNKTEGTPWLQQVLVKNPVNAEASLKAVAINTPGVIQLNSFSLDINDVTRKAVVDFDVQGDTGPIPGQVEINIPQ